MQTISYQHRRGELQVYFDRTAADAWAKLTSDAPVGRIRATVRAGRDQMRARLLDWLPDDLAGKSGCWTRVAAPALSPWKPRGAARMSSQSTCRRPSSTWRANAFRATSAAAMSNSWLATCSTRRSASSIMSLRWIH